MGAASTTPEGQREATLRLVEAAAAIGQAVSELRVVVMGLNHQARLSGQDTADSGSRIDAALAALNTARDGLNAANQALGATDD